MPTLAPVRRPTADTRPRKTYAAALLIALALALSACAPVQPLHPEQYLAPPPVERPNTEVYFYPTAGQSTARQDRDRYECYLWAVQQSGFDPSQPQLAPHQRIEVVPASPPGQQTAAGAIIGAAMGAAIAEPHHSAKGAVTGAIAGALLGAASEQTQQDQAQQRYDLYATQHSAQLERKASDYRRAMSACLEGRGYSVR